MLWFLVSTKCCHTSTSLLNGELSILRLPLSGTDADTGASADSFKGPTIRVERGHYQAINIFSPLWLSFSYVLIDLSNQTTDNFPSDFKSFFGSFLVGSSPPSLALLSCDHFPHTLCMCVFCTFILFVL